MFPAERRHRILELVRQNGAISLGDLAEAVQTSKVTVRRDVRALEADGLIDRRHGGAMVPGANNGGPSGASRRGTAGANSDSTVLAALALASGNRGLPAGTTGLGEAAASLVRPGDAIVLGAGPETEEMARSLARIPSLVVVTNSLAVAGCLADAAQIEIVITGGILRGSIALVGDAVEQSMAGIRVSRAFLCGSGLTAERGLSTQDILIAGADRALAASAAEVVVLANVERLGRDGMFKTVPANEISHLVVPTAEAAATVKGLADAGTRIHVADPVVDAAQAGGWRLTRAASF